MSRCWWDRRTAFLSADPTIAFEPVGTMLDETEQDIIKEISYDVQFESRELEAWNELM